MDFCDLLLVGEEPSFLPRTTVAGAEASLLRAVQLILWTMRPSASSVVQAGKEVQLGCMLMSEKRESSRLVLGPMFVPVPPKGGRVRPKEGGPRSGCGSCLAVVACSGSGGGGIVDAASPVC